MEDERVDMVEGIRRVQVLFSWCEYPSSTSMVYVSSRQAHVTYPLLTHVVPIVHVFGGRPFDGPRTGKKGQRKEVAKCISRKGRGGAANKRCHNRIETQMRERQRKQTTHYETSKPCP